MTNITDDIHIYIYIYIYIYISEIRKGSIRLRLQFPAPPFTHHHQFPAPLLHTPPPIYACWWPPPRCSGRPVGGGAPRGAMVAVYGWWCIYGWWCMYVVYVWMVVYVCGGVWMVVVYGWWWCMAGCATPPHDAPHHHIKTPIPETLCGTPRDAVSLEPVFFGALDCCSFSSSRWEVGIWCTDAFFFSSTACILARTGEVSTGTGVYRAKQKPLEPGSVEK